MSVKRVFSAGGIVVRKVPKGTPLRPAERGFAGQAEGTRGTGGIEVLVTQHSGHHGWDFPKGHLEIGESSEQAALREVEEETGVKAEIIEKVGQTKYFYYEGGEKIFKTVTFFLMKYLSDGEATTAFEVSAKKWLPVEEVEKQLTFKDTKKLWGNARKRIEQLSDELS